VPWVGRPRGHRVVGEDRVNGLVIVREARWVRRTRKPEVQIQQDGVHLLHHTSHLILRERLMGGWVGRWLALTGLVAFQLTGGVSCFTHKRAIAVRMGWSTQQALQHHHSTCALIPCTCGQQYGSEDLLWYGRQCSPASGARGSWVAGPCPGSRTCCRRDHVAIVGTPRRACPDSDPCNYLSATGQLTSSHVAG